MKKVDCLIIGAGLAGLSTAWHLSQRGAHSILVIDKEAGAGHHSSGRNAAMVMQVTRDPVTSGYARRGAAFLRACAQLWGADIGYRRNGSVLIGTSENLDAYAQTIADCRKDGIPVMLLSRRECIARVPLLDDLEFHGGIECPFDGWLDLEKLNGGYVREITKRGVGFWSRCRASAIERSPEGTFLVRTNRESIETPVIVNASGAWATEVGEMAGASHVPMEPYCRHIVQTAHVHGVSPGWPIVWDLANGYYFRPEAGGLLMSPCDQTPASAGTPEVDEALLSSFREKMTTLLPSLNNYKMEKSWAGLRTIPSDGKFVVGWDPLLQGFYWVAGLGGHGVVVSAALGEMAADQLLEHAASRSTTYDPSRFQGVSA